MQTIYYTAVFYSTRNNTYNRDMWPYESSKVQVHNKLFKDFALL